MAESEHRSLDVIETELSLADEEIRALNDKVKEAEGRLTELITERAAHPKYKRIRQEVADLYLRESLGDYLYSELVAQRGFKSVYIAKWRVETRHRNIYNECCSVKVTFKDGKKFEHESGDWGFQGYKFTPIPSYDKMKGESVAAAWAMCCKLNPNNDAGAIMALAMLALHWNGIDGMLDKAGAEALSEDDEGKRRADLTPYLLHQLLKVLKPQEVKKDEEPATKKRKFE